MSSSNWNDG